ncbi:hypothetical protein AX16_009354 [Volvariella volvacea WC 439]|nr:hypothetical protein AX16_009354 [Volvariella volvacea WC 439]
MSKRKQSTNKAEDSDDSGSNVSLVDVSFDFFDPNPKIDYHALKRLFSQLFQRDAELLNVHELTELVLSQPTVGTTIKTDGLESDPYAILTVLNMHVHKDHPAIKAIAQYILSKSAPDPALHATLQGLFSQSEKHVGLVLCERLINMPVQVIPPMYKMLKDEMQWAIDDGEPYTFSHLIIISRSYHLTAEEESSISTNTPVKPSASKRAKKAAANAATGINRPTDGLYPFHPEDECTKQFATHTLNYPYSNNNEPREKDSFGLDVRGRVMLVPGGRFEELITRMQAEYGVQQ